MNNYRRVRMNAEMSRASAAKALKMTTERLRQIESDEIAPLRGEVLEMYRLYADRVENKTQTASMLAAEYGRRNA